MQQLLTLSTFLLVCLGGYAQSSTNKLALKVVTQEDQPLPNATIELFRHTDTVLLKIALTDTAGQVSFSNLSLGEYYCRIQHTGYISVQTSTLQLIEGTQHITLSTKLLRLGRTLHNVTVTAPKSLLEIRQRKTIVNIESSIIQAGATALETLEKLPGVSIDRNGNIALKGKTGVLILLDGKPTYMDNAALTNLLSGMNASMISQIEIMEQPPVRYEASGNAGVINIKTKRIRQKGFYATVTTAHMQGQYYKHTNSLQLSYKTGRIQLYANYSQNYGRNFTRLYALRTYVNAIGLQDQLLEQHTLIKSQSFSNTIQTGLEYFMSAKTSIGLSLNGNLWKRKNKSNNEASWMNVSQQQDSLIQTGSNNSSQQRNGSLTFFIRHQLDSTRELSIDMDALQYRPEEQQLFTNIKVLPDTYTETYRAHIPSTIKIFSARADYNQQFGKLRFESGFKTSHITTDNNAGYQYFNDPIWEEDLNKSNHFLYKETIHALYSSIQTPISRWILDGGLRFERTDYQGIQLGNALQKDSSFYRHYNSLFPSTSLTFEANSKHTFSFAAGRRIERPAFQKLNPFIFIINKYTYQQGNPFFRPQYTWNFTFSHQFKKLLSTEISYSQTKDYFSQLFLSGPNGVMIYSEGNVGKMNNLGASITLQLAPCSWWSLSAQTAVNRKILSALLWKLYDARIIQFNTSLSNQLRFEKGWGVELTCFYTGRSKQDIQEIINPSGQVAIGFSKAIFKNMATIKGAFRDLFYTQRMEGNTTFENATEYFKLTRDTRVATLSFNYHFGKPLKGSKRKESSAAEEISRTGN